MKIAPLSQISCALVGGLIVPLLILAAGCANPPGHRLARAHVRGLSCGASSEGLEAAAADRNRQSLYTTALNLFGRPETGWAVYAPAIEHEIRVGCAADTPGFADALARWARPRHAPADGVLTPETLALLKAEWQARRPFVLLRAKGVCPPPPPSSELADVPSEAAYPGKAIQVRRDALAAWARLVRDARMAQPELAANGELLRIFSAFRSPAYDDARCARDDNCQGTVRAACSAHRTGLAMDVVLDTAPGYTVDSTADTNRLAMTRGLAYRWLTANAGRYGFVNYVFEPWHWEWTGARV